MSNKFLFRFFPLINLFLLIKYSVLWLQTVTVVNLILVLRHYYVYFIRGSKLQLIEVAINGGLQVYFFNFCFSARISRFFFKTTLGWLTHLHNFLLNCWPRNLQREFNFFVYSTVRRLWQGGVRRFEFEFNDVFKAFYSTFKKTEIARFNLVKLYWRYTSPINKYIPLFLVFKKNLRSNMFNTCKYERCSAVFFQLLPGYKTATPLKLKYRVIGYRTTRKLFFKFYYYPTRLVYTFSTPQLSYSQSYTPVNLDAFKSLQFTALKLNTALVGGRTALRSVFSYSKYNDFYNSAVLNSNTSFKLQLFKLQSAVLLNLKPLKNRILQFLKLTDLNAERYFDAVSLKLNLNYKFKFNLFFSYLTRAERISTTTANYSAGSLLYGKSRSLFHSNSSIWASKVNLRRITWQRREFLMFFRKPFRYQTRLSRFILKFYRLKVNEFVWLFEFNVLWVLFKSKLVFYKSTAQRLFKLKSLYINTKLVSEEVELSRICLSTFDTLYLFVCIRIYLYILWDSFAYLFKNKRFLFYVYKWRLRRLRPYPKESSYRIPNWVLKLNMFKGSVPIFFEVDYSTLTIIILYFRYYNFNYLMSSTFLISPVGSTRNHNWKSLV